MLSLGKEYVAQKAKGILRQSDPALSSEFAVMPSARRYYRPLRTKNYDSKFYVLLLSGWQMLTVVMVNDWYILLT